MCVRILVHTCIIHVYTCIYMYIHVYTYLSMYIYICIYIYIYAYIYISFFYPCPAQDHQYGETAEIHRGQNYHWRLHLATPRWPALRSFAKQWSSCEISDDTKIENWTMWSRLISSLTLHFLEGVHISLSEPLAFYGGFFLPWRQVGLNESFDIKIAKQVERGIILCTYVWSFIGSIMMIK